MHPSHKLRFSRQPCSYTTRIDLIVGIFILREVQGDLANWNVCGRGRRYKALDGEHNLPVCMLHANERRVDSRDAVVKTACHYGSCVHTLEEMPTWNA